MRAAEALLCESISLGGNSGTTESDDAAAKLHKYQSLRTAYDTLYGFILAAGEQDWLRGKLMRHLDLLYEEAMTSCGPSVPSANSGDP